MVGENIKKIRIARGLTQKELADILNVTQGQVSQWEHSDALKIPTLEKIAEALQITVFAFLADSLNIENLSQDDLDNLEPIIYDEKGQVFREGLYCIDESETNIIKSYLEKLNQDGKIEAIKRIEELSMLEKYTKKEKD